MRYELVAGQAGHSGGGEAKTTGGGTHRGSWLRYVVAALLVLALLSMTDLLLLAFSEARLFWALSVIALALLVPFVLWTRLTPLFAGTAGTTKYEDVRVRNSAHASTREEVQRELDRGRRYERPFCLLRTPILPDTSTSTPTRVDGTSPRLVELLRARVRSTDRVWYHRSHVYLLLPECDREAAEGLLTRLAALGSGILKAEKTQIAVFPHDGTTAGALLASLDDVGLAPARPRQAHRRSRSLGGNVRQSTVSP